MFSTVLHLLLYSLTVTFLHYFLLMPVGFNLNLTNGLKPQVNSIKIVTVYRRSIFQVESHYTTRTAPRFFCSKKLSPVQRSSYLDGWPNTTTPCWINLFFLHSLSKAMFKTAELPALCDVVSSISQLFVPHFAISAFTCILQHSKNKQPNASFEFFSILLTFDRLKQQLRSYCYL